MKNKRWSTTQIFGDAVIMDNGVVSSISMEEVIEKLNELEDIKTFLQFDPRDKSVESRQACPKHKGYICVEECDGLKILCLKSASPIRYNKIRESITKFSYSEATPKDVMRRPNHIRNSSLLTEGRVVISTGIHLWKWLRCLLCR